MNIYIVLGIVLFITFGAHIYISIVFNIAKNRKSLYGKTGGAVAKEILDKYGVQDVKIRKADTLFADHYLPFKKTIRLSKDNYEGKTIAGMCMAAHECGHAIQHHSGYKFLTFRNVLTPIFSLGSIVGYTLIIISLLCSLPDILEIGTYILLGILLFHILTIPIEFNASTTAVQRLLKYDLVKEKEYRITRKVLKAAGLTYIAGVSAPLLDLYRLVVVTFRD